VEVKAGVKAGVKVRTLEELDAEEWRRLADRYGVLAANAARKVLRLRREPAMSERSPGEACGLRTFNGWMRWRRSRLLSLVSQSGEQVVVAVGECLSCRGWGLADGGLDEGWCSDCGGTGRTLMGGGSG